MNNSQLIKKQKQGGYENIYPLAFVQGVIDRETKEKLPDILCRYNHIYLPWTKDRFDTRNLVPLVLRRKGLFITYLNNGDTVKTEVCKGILQNIKTYWNDDSNWELSPDMEYVRTNASKIPNGAVLPSHLSPSLQQLISESKNITNLADDEDLTSVENVLKFKDKIYNKELASGMGYKILRKNFVDGKNVLTQDKINESNTIYEIRYDFDLNNQSITIKEGCILKYKGGSISNGTINYSNTIIDGKEDLRKTITTGKFTYLSKANVNPEDLEYSSEDKLQLANRPSTDGMGYKILRRGNGILNSNDLSTPNTIYEIRYDFDLEGNTVNIPANCVLKFKGGSLNNGDIVFSDTELLGSIKLNINNVSGSIINPHISYYWFKDIDKTINFAKSCNIPIKDSYIKITKDVSFRGIEIDINYLQLQGYKLELGGIRKETQGEAFSNYTQRIGKIDTYGENQIFIRFAVGQKIIIDNSAKSIINLRLNPTDSYIAYSKFKFGTIKGVFIDVDREIPNPTNKTLWCNENLFILQRCSTFIIDGTNYKHDNNRIEGGCFEGNVLIDIRCGRNNIFKGLRLEGKPDNIKINFGEKSNDNLVQCLSLGHTSYINTVDKGVGNSVQTLKESLYRIITFNSIKSDSFEEHSYKATGFKNFKLSLSGDSIQATGGDQSILFESEFIPFNTHKNVAFLVNTIFKKGISCAVKYRLYDENFKLLSKNASMEVPEYIEDDSYFLNTTKYLTIEGEYVRPDIQSTNITSSTLTSNIKNDYICLYPSGNFNNERTPIAVKKIKYVKFFIIKSHYFFSQEEADACEYYSMNAYVYDLSGNYHHKYFN